MFALGCLGGYHHGSRSRTWKARKGEGVRKSSRARDRIASAPKPALAERRQAQGRWRREPLQGGKGKDNASSCTQLTASARGIVRAGDAYLAEPRFGSFVCRRTMQSKVL